MTGSAEVRIAGRVGLFVADVATVDGLWLHAEGRFRTRVGANHGEFRWGELAAYSWPVGEVVEIRWQGVASC